MGEKDTVYAVILDIWGMFKKHGFQRLSDSEWEKFAYESLELNRKYKKMGKRYEMLYRRMYDAVYLYYRDIGTKGEMEGQLSFELGQGGEASGGKQ